VPLHAQPAYRHYPSVAMPASERLSSKVVSLPMHPYLDAGTQDRIIDAVLESAGGR
jgi:dTDP-4-amino-4,6-dideoxygalactose transaminase